MTKKLIVLMGNIGTGKSTYCKDNFINGEIIICPDNINLPKSERQTKMFTEIEKGLSENKTVVIDGVNLTRHGRDMLLYFGKKEKCMTILIDFGKGDLNSLNRRINDSKETSKEEWTNTHEENLRKYEKPNYNEGFDKIISIY
jgi:predicted kinase